MGDVAKRRRYGEYILEDLVNRVCELLLFFKTFGLLVLCSASIRLCSFCMLLHI